MVEVVGSFPACSHDCLARFVVAKSKLRWRVPVAYDNGQQVVRSLIFYSASHA